MLTHYLCAMSFTMKNSEFRIIEQLKQGNRQAYEHIFRKYYSTLCAYARLYVKDMQVCENLVQDLMLVLWENRTAITITDSLSGYLFRAVKNSCFKHLDHEEVESRYLGMMRDRFSKQFESPDFYAIKELEKNIRAAVESLPKSYREAFEMSRYEKLTYSEIAERLGVSSKTVDYRICQSLKYLRAALKDFLPLIAFFPILQDLL